jgi:antitoxin component of MazEF toxin-antitoxin module
MQTRRTLRKVGGSMMLPIPPEMLEEMSLGPGQDAVLSSEGDVIQGGAVGTQALAGRRGGHGPVYEEI